MGSPIYIYTDHKTLINFEAQCDLSWQQLQWQELMSQYETHISYICGEDNMVADDLSWLPDGDILPLAPHAVWALGVNATMLISMDWLVLSKITNGYKLDPFCERLSHGNLPSAKFVNGLWYVGSCLLIPRVGNICEQLYQLAHDTLGHFRSDKSYATLRGAY